MLITKIQLESMERIRIPEDERKDFYLYVDEFQNFATDSFADVLSEARKYRLNLIIAHQYIGQLITETTTKVRDSVFGNVGTIISFRVGAADAEFLEKEFFPEFSLRDLVNLDNYNVYLKMMIDGVSSRPFSATTLPPMDTGVTNQREKIVNISRERYANSREQVEAKIAKWSGVSSESSEEEKNIQKSKEPFLKKNKTTCWSCGKETEVSFEPDGRRPVYCKDCFEKAKKGEELSLRFKPEIKQEIIRDTVEKPEQQSELRELGIEFGASNIPKTPSSVSLKDAVEKEPVSFKNKRTRKEVDLKDLRKTLEDVMDK